MTARAYNVPVILPDLRKEESYHQIVDALEYLDAVANDVFNRITCRVADNRDQLTLINNRILTAQAKIDKLRSASTKAARVFSSPKYPAPDSVTDYRTIYQNVNPLLQKVRKTKAQIDTRLPEVTADLIKAKSRPVAISFRRKRLSKERATDMGLEVGEGLGSLPRHLPSVSSLLLFNTAENPYKKYVVLDPLEGAKTKTRDKIIEEEKMADAPFSITQGEELGRAQQDSIMYVPLMPELSQLDVPEMLPQLQYVASDVFYSADVGASIAPSLANVPELPNLADPEAPAATDTPLPPPTTSASSSEPPPPPSAPAPPPPPVAAPPLPAVGEQSGDSSDEGEGDGGGAEAPPDAGDGRANLMEAIRKAGGASKAGLKDAKDRKHKRKARKEEQKEESSPGDLLTDLSAALGRRRKAMSGKDKPREREREKEDHSLGGGSMMDNISKMIPAPPSSSHIEESIEEHSEDEGAW